ncbi:uncharacterized protein [Musca autumnalis]|uniref:uncharacterized protein n=1 Tax=Musca autumnalis TaxID=221902 RepID=UPI003CF80DFA
MQQNMACNNTTTKTTSSASTINNNRKTQVVGSGSNNNNKNNHFSNSNNKLLASGTTANAAASSSLTTTTSQNGISCAGNALLKPQHSSKRLSILNSHKHLAATTTHNHYHDQSLYQLQAFPPPTPASKQTNRSSLGPAPHFSYTLQNNKSSNKSQAQGFYHNSLKAKDLRVLKLSLAKDPNSDDTEDDDDIDGVGGGKILPDDRGDEDSDYYMPSSLEILGIQKALENLEKSVGNAEHGDGDDDDDNHCVSDNAELSDNDDNVERTATTMANDFELTKNATNNLLKLQQQDKENDDYEQQQQEEDEQNITNTTTTTTNRLWYH